MGKTTLIDIYQRLYDYYGPQYWWPGETVIEIIVGAILTQNTSWSNVEKAIANLKKADCLDVAKLQSISVEQLGVLIRPAGYYNIKAQRLKSFINWLFQKHQGDLAALNALSPSRLRTELLAIKGIGPETADSIGLYAFGKPVFVVDAYTARVFGRHGWLEPGCGYEEIQDLFQSHLEKDPVLYNEFHALIVRVGKEHCRPKPLCSGCPLEPLPHRTESFD